MQWDSSQLLEISAREGCPVQDFYRYKEIRRSRRPTSVVSWIGIRFRFLILLKSCILAQDIKDKLLKLSIKSEKKMSKTHQFILSNKMHKTKHKTWYMFKNAWRTSTYSQSHTYSSSIPIPTCISYFTWEWLASALSDDTLATIVQVDLQRALLPP